MKSILKTNPSKENVVTYPCLKIRHIPNTPDMFVVLFSCDNHGMVVYSNCSNYPVGYSYSWTSFKNTDVWKDFDGEVILSNK